MSLFFIFLAYLYIIYFLFLLQINAGSGNEFGVLNLVLLLVWIEKESVLFGLVGVVG